ncbi:sodium:solute symporter [Cytophagales bacterium LB-30]|uniref:Sodium:solute symporter n=1 Tax=Shiella aurantiaca TaxID=3058365 RepID=A0ABT8F4J1_9BACT|nr:sodium:solute symporter [Shiella aurantiaca]MDN4165370.1 sodium:solute symporter [Shiella aurantiaca]
MSLLDWSVLIGTLLFITLYGVYKTRGSQSMESYLMGDKSLKWWTIGLSIMATQASAITFLSTPGQAYEDGMRFIQFYFGLPIAMVILSVTVIPIYYRLKVYTAYEYLEGRFDLKTRSLTALLFLIQRGLAAGITIYAPAIILSTILGWPLSNTCFLIGVLVIIYTVSGGSKAVSVTQKQQMMVMMGGMIIAGIMVVNYLPDSITFGKAIQVAGDMGKLNMVDFSFNPNDRYNIWSGLIGGLFVALAYFGTDQSQVARYLGGKSLTESRLGLLFNGLLKIPMQLLILFIGAMVFVFYQFYQPPVFFNQAATEIVRSSEWKTDFEDLEQKHTQLFEQKQDKIQALLLAREQGQEAEAESLRADIKGIESQSKAVKAEVVSLVKKANPDAEPKDTDYVFITFIMNHLPQGLVGLLLAVIFSAAMSSTSSELSALGSTTLVDMYKRNIRPSASDGHYLKASRAFTALWGFIALTFAVYASMLDNLIQAVNILGSIFYGTMLGIFLVAFYFKKIGGNSVFYAALVAEAVVVYFFFMTDIGFLWYNVIGCLGVIVLSSVLQVTVFRR